MYEKYLIRTAGFRNFVEDGRVVGVAVDTTIAYYRGVVLAIIADLQLRIDGELYRDERLRFEVGGRRFTMAELAREETVRWEFGQPASLIALRDGGLAAGAHEIELTQTIKPAYIPGPGFQSSTVKTLTLPSTAAPDAPPPPTGLGVSLYSYQEEYYVGALSLEDCVREVAASGATGVQLIPEQMMPGYPDPPEAVVTRWHALLEELGLTPTLMDTMVDMSVGGHRQMSIEEGVAQLVTQMQLAKRLGFPAIRPTTGPTEDAAPELIEAALPHAERLDVVLAPEIHAPVRLGGPLTTSYLEMIERTGTAHLGFTLDLGVFCHHLPPALIAWARRLGATDDNVALAERAYADETPFDEIGAQVAAAGGSYGAETLARRVRAFGPPSNRVEDLAEILPHTVNVHAKFYEVTEDGREEAIDYPLLMAALRESGYAGFADSEYEGQRLTQDAEQTDSCEQVRRHQLLMRRTLAV